MIALTKYIATTGQIIGQIYVSSEEDATLNVSSLEEGQALILGEWHWDMYYVDAEEVLVRPVIELPQLNELEVNEEWIIPDIPSETAVNIDNVEVGITDGTELELSFEAAGVWKVELKPPFPWVGATCEVTVT